MNKISSRDELIELLKKYKGVLSKSMFDYLNQLIELEFSVIRDNISDNDREALSELDIYKKIATYNIYNRALNLFSNQSEEFRVYGNDNCYEGLKICAISENEEIKLFDFNFSEHQEELDYKIPSEYKNMEIGTISLFQTLESEEMRKAELNGIMTNLERLYDEQNSFRSSIKSRIFGGYDAIRALQRNEKIEEYENEFKRLDGKKGLTDVEKRKVEITKKYHDLLLEDYNLTNEAFVKEESIFNQLLRGYTHLNKTLIKEMPNLKINNNIKYI